MAALIYVTWRGSSESPPAQCTCPLPVGPTQAARCAMFHLFQLWTKQIVTVRKTLFSKRKNNSIWKEGKNIAHSQTKPPENTARNLILHTRHEQTAKGGGRLLTSWAWINNRAGDLGDSRCSSPQILLREKCAWELRAAADAQSSNLPVKAKDLADRLLQSSCDKGWRTVQWDLKVLSRHSTDAPGCSYPFTKLPKQSQRWPKFHSNW